MDTPTLVGTGFVLTGLVVWIVCIILAFQIAKQRGRRPVVWAILTVFFGPLALFALYVMKPKHVAGHGPTGKAAHADPRADLYEVPKKH
jgi:hypothetical protein